MPHHLPVASGTLTLVSFILTGIVVGNAYYQKKQFYPSVVYITKSNPSMAAVYLLAFTLVILLGKLLKKVFFGQLRPAELEQLVERSFYAVTETCLAFAVFKDDFSPKFVALFTVLLFLKAFHYLTDSRVDFMERSPVITTIFHVRVLSLLFTLFALDLSLVNYSYQSTIMHGASVQLVFGFEYAILLTVALNVFVKYLCHTIDLRLENPWDNKTVYLLYTDLLVGLIKVLLYCVFLMIMLRIHTFPLFILRPMYLTLRSFKSALNGVIQSRRAIHNMNTHYPDATTEELAAVDNVCIICREEMALGAKKVPCGHIFHRSCLRSWFQRQQTCPTCRMDILRQNVPSNTTQAAAQRQQPQPAADAPRAPQPNAPNGNPFAAFGAGIPPFPFPPLQINQMQNLQQQAHHPQNPPTTASTSAPSASTSAPTITTSAGTSTTSRTREFVFDGITPPPFPFMPIAPVMPTLPANFEGLTTEELKQIEGNERKHIEARIKTLRNINTLINAAAFQLSQYHTIVGSLPLESTVEPESTTEVHTSTDTPSSEEGAVGFSEEPPGAEDHNEIRRRRLQKFSNNDTSPNTQ